MIPTVRSEDLEFNNNNINSYSNNNNGKSNKNKNDHKNVNIKNSSTLSDFKSINPNIDILNLSFRKGAYKEDEIGFIQIPVTFLLNPDFTSKAMDRFITMNAWKMIFTADQCCKFTTSKFTFVWKLLSIHHSTNDKAIESDDIQSNEIVADDNKFDNNSQRQLDATTYDDTSDNNRLLPSSQGSVKSITGQLLCCIEGFFLNRGSNKDSNPNSMSTSPFSKGSSIGLEVILWPEGTKTSSLLCVPILLPKDSDSNDIEAIVELKKSFNMLITVALQQVSFTAALIDLLFNA